VRLGPRFLPWGCRLSSRGRGRHPFGPMPASPRVGARCLKLDGRQARRLHPSRCLLREPSKSEKGRGAVGPGLGQTIFWRLLPGGSTCAGTRSPYGDSEVRLSRSKKGSELSSVFGALRHKLPSLDPLGWGDAPKSCPCQKVCPACTHGMGILTPASYLHAFPQLTGRKRVTVV
jgi:hypothetical protein